MHIPEQLNSSARINPANANAMRRISPKRYLFNMLFTSFLSGYLFFGRKTSITFLGLPINKEISTIPLLLLKMKSSAL